jgi:hypothetical protein
MAYAVSYGFKTGKSDSGTWRGDRAEVMYRLRQKQALGTLKIIEAFMAIPSAMCVAVKALEGLSAPPSH